MRVHQNAWERVSQARKLRYGIDKMVCVWLIKFSESMVGMMMDVQVGQHDCTVHAQEFSHLERWSR